MLTRQGRKEVKTVSEKEKKIINSLSNVINLFSDENKARFLGYSEGYADGYADCNKNRKEGNQYDTAAQAASTV